MIKKFNFVVIATHHGAFVTLQSIFELPASKLGNVIVVVPQHQLDKYATYTGDPLFTDYLQHLKDFIGTRKGVELFVFPDGEWIVRNPILCTAKCLENQKKKGLYICLSAGAIFNKKNIDRHMATLESMPQESALMVTHARAYEHSPSLNMYHMVGLPPSLPVEARFNKQTFLIDASKLKFAQINYTRDQSILSERPIKVIDHKMLCKYDELIEKALPSQVIARHGVRSNQALASFYWPQAMTEPSKLSQEMIWGCGPLVRYAELAKKVAKYIPPKTLEYITANGAECAKATKAIFEVLG